MADADLRSRPDDPDLLAGVRGRRAPEAPKLLDDLAVLQRRAVAAAFIDQATRTAPQARIDAWVEA